MVADNIHTWEDLADEAEEIVTTFYEFEKARENVYLGYSPMLAKAFDWLRDYKKAVAARRVDAASNHG